MYTGGQIHKVAIILCVMSASLSAQWPNHPTQGVPRKADGKPDLMAPAPRSADGKPDLSGVWRVKQNSYLVYVTSDLKPDEVRPWAAALYKQRADDYRKDSDGIACLPPGPKAGISGLGLPMKIVQTPNLVVVLYEYETIFRQIFTDGRALPEDPNPTWMGYSVGHWDNDTLVVSTAGYNDRTTIDLGGHPHTEALRVTERFHRRDAGHIDLEVTLDDPKAYARAWTLPIELDLIADGDLIEYFCENEKDAKHLVGKSGEEAHVSHEILAQYAGTYDTAVISVEDTHLTINTNGGGNIPLVAHGDNDFTMEGTGIEFVRDPKGSVTGMIQHWVEGDRLLARRK
jgi:hypothetical protein